jgi:hypothetical protein
VRPTDGERLKDEKMRFDRCYVFNAKQQVAAGSSSFHITMDVVLYPRWSSSRTFNKTMKLLLPILFTTVAAASITITVAAENKSSNLSLPSSLGFISKPHRHHLSFASGRTSASLVSRESNAVSTTSSTSRKRGSRQKLNLKNQHNDMEKQSEKVLQIIHTFGANLILQVFGGAGAIWGFSEVIGLRTPSTVWFWRPAAQFFGAVFFARWVLELSSHLEKEDLKLFGRSSSALPLEMIMSESSSDEEFAAATDESKLLMMESF